MSKSITYVYHIEVTVTESLCALDEFLGLAQELLGEIPRSVLCLVEQSHHLQNILRKKIFHVVSLNFMSHSFHVSFSALLLDLFFFKLQ